MVMIPSLTTRESCGFLQEGDRFAFFGFGQSQRPLDELGWPKDCSKAVLTGVKATGCVPPRADPRRPGIDRTPAASRGIARAAIRGSCRTRAVTSGNGHGQGDLVEDLVVDLVEDLVCCCVLV
jgi:hypothetical protein